MRTEYIRWIELINNKCSDNDSKDIIKDLHKSIKYIESTFSNFALNYDNNMVIDTTKPFKISSLVKDIKSLKSFFSQCIEKNKLQKTKDIIYNKDTREITSIPPLYFNTQNHNFSLKIMDSKRVSTLKSLTPKRTSERNIEES